MPLDATSAPAAAARHQTSIWLSAWQVLAMLHSPILITLFYLMWFSARMMLGRWPRWGGADDPKSIPVTSVIDLAISLWLLLLPFVFGFAAVRIVQGLQHRDGTGGRRLRQGLVMAAGLCATGFFLAGNPHHLVTWFLD